MDIFFADPDDVPVPPEDMEIRALEVDPYPDGRRVAIRFRLSPFQKRPNVEVSVTDDSGSKVAEVSIVETTDPAMDFTVHIRKAETGGRYAVHMRVFYSNLDEFDPAGREGLGVGQILDETGWTVAARESSFEIPSGE
ncbi:MAG: hypothetical protein EPO32_00015 [Anaerolineae bacterium]|nr:MAG: hypothetical protein EPO32_00015 [Anaerolineae bacterium]